MKLISRFTSNEALEFKFELPEDGLQNKQTLFVSQVAINFTAPPTTASDVQIFISDDEGEDLIWEDEAMSQTHLRFSPNSHIPVKKGAKRIIRYANPDTVEVTARFLWHV